MAQGSGRTVQGLELTLTQARRTVAEIKKAFNITHCKTTEEDIAGEVKFVDLHIRFKICPDKKTLDINNIQL